ncbi:L-aspartate oxidase [Ancylobacter defluvii]|uniref:L-aspartate oxidase n=1 Tax=Ancylobacter defluvii TaxID=1282440 RepID=A0A9W6JZS5_9HYPH|nr:L-aspartate oxidase [Ancylobacter defluvii]MBS7589483.1 L-aspartate oxidase [Ancylobacter defluvii]GLK85100.1 L-aspartate oxidase [Ancylobacter defluvii]
MTHTDRARTDGAIVIGGGIAGLATALHLAAGRLPVTLLVAGPLGAGAATFWAQGGIAAALGADDRPDLHAIDTLTAGAGLAEPEAARRVAGAAPAAIDWLVSIGAPFDRAAGGALALGLEAAHSRRRIVHAEGDGTGRVVLQTLIAAVRANPLVTLLEGTSATALLTDAQGGIAGVAVRDMEGHAAELTGRAVVLATGGLGALYASTTNPLGATGSGLALAARAGAVMRDMEFVQFHPTAIACGADPMPLATEALRGEGARLFNDRGDRFMADIPGAELAPRDVVARAIFAELAAGRRVVLDARLKHVERRFPGVVALCRANGLDPLRDPIPVRPAAHYHMGGVEVDATGRSGLPGLWACGEVASTGLHGANRLASNSLLEALAYAGWIAADIAAAIPAGTPPPAAVPALPAPPAPALRQLMDRQVGVVRDKAGLAEAVATLAGAGDEDATRVALMVASAALARSESRGGHFRADHPHPATPTWHSRLTLGQVAEPGTEPEPDRVRRAAMTDDAERQVA